MFVSAAFFVKYRKPIVYGVAAVVMLASLYFAAVQVLDKWYQKGKSEADKVWVTRHNTEVAAKNKRIAELESKAQESVERLEGVKDTAQKLIDASVAKWEAAKKTPTGKVHLSVKCPTTNSTNSPVIDEPLQLQLDTKDLVLPVDYVKAWNSINETTRP